MIRYASLIVGLFSSCVVAAPADFARGRIVQPQGAATIQRITVPQDVYEWVVRSDLGDLRVYNAEQQEMPYAIRRPAHNETQSPWVDLPVFVLPALQENGERDTLFNIELGDSGAVVAVHGATAGNQPSAGFLIDASAIDVDIAELDIDWAEDTGQFVGKFQVQASDDLNTWRTAVSSVTLATLDSFAPLLAEGREIVVDEISLPGTRTRYLKIIQLEGATPIVIEAVRARSRRSQLPVRHWKTLTGTQAKQGTEYDTGGKFPLDRISLESTDPTFLITAKLFSRRSSEDQWRHRGERTFYRVEVDGSIVTSDPIAFANSDRYWRVETSNEGPVPPSLKVGWLPDEIIFLKQGTAPYLMAYGQADITGRQWPMRDLVNRLDDDVEIQNVPRAGLSSANTLGGSIRLVSAPDPVDWATILLWVVLLIGVAGIVTLAVRLVRQ